MIVNKQKSIEFINDCNCLVDYIELEKAILWYQISKDKMTMEEVRKEWRDLDQKENFYLR